MLASDPSILVDGNRLRMFYTTADAEPDAIRPAIAEAISADGVTWTPLGGNTATGIVVSDIGGAQANLEGACIFKAGSTYVLLYSGYADSPGSMAQFPAVLHGATSTDGIHFTPLPGAVLAPTRGWLDNDAVYSPTVIAVPNGYLMFYCGHCYTDASAPGGRYGVSILAAFSSDGLTWTQREQPILQSSQAMAWMRDGVAEPSLVRGPDGKYYLFFTGLQDDDRVIGLAVATDPLGPWTVQPEPILTAESVGLAPGGTVIAPEAVLSNGVLRLWYTQATPDGAHVVAQAEASWGGTGARLADTSVPHWVGTVLDDTMLGVDGADLMTLDGGRDVADGAAGNDRILGEAGDDSMAGGAGNDLLDGGTGSDVLEGGLGDDTLLGGVGNDVLAGGDGIDSLVGGDGLDVLDGGGGADTLLGGADGDTLSGGAGNDLLDGGTGADVLDGGLGNDRLDGGDGDDSCSGGDGNDSLSGGSGANRLVGGLGRDTLQGGDGADLLDGGAGIDLLRGGAGNDTLWGGSGDDSLAGGAGADQLWSQAGRDALIYAAVTDSAVAAPDRIGDFAPGLDHFVFQGLLAGTFGYVGSAAFVASGQSQARFSAASRTLEIDVNGNGLADMAIILDNITAPQALAARDFVWS